MVTTNLAAHDSSLADIGPFLATAYAVVAIGMAVILVMLVIKSVRLDTMRPDRAALPPSDMEENTSVLTARGFSGLATKLPISGRVRPVSIMSRGHGETSPDPTR